MPVQAPQRTVEIAIVGALAIYFALQVLVRLVGFPALGLDERELVYIASSLEWGRGSQPPLYSWLQWGAFQALGTNLLALAVVKNLLLFLTFLGSFLTARRIFATPGPAVVTTLLLFTIPQLGWESQRALSHTVLVVCVAVWATYIFLRMAATGATVKLSGIFGALCALGILSKYNFFILAACLVLSATFDRQTRRAIFRPALLLAVPVFLLLTAPHGLWAIDNMGQVLSRVSKFEIDNAAPTYIAPFRALWAVLVGGVSYLVLPALIIVPAVFLPSRQPAQPPIGTDQTRRLGRLLLRIMALALLLTVAGLAIAQGSNFKDRWLQPVLFVFPLGMVAVYGHHLSKLRLRVLAGIGVMCALLAFVGLGVLQVWPTLKGQPGAGTEPYAAHAEQIRQLGFRSGYILAPMDVAGNLRLLFSSSAILLPEHPETYRPTSESQILLAWKGEKLPLPAALSATLQQLCQSPSIGYPIELVAPYQADSRIVHHLNVIVLPACPVATPP